MATSGTVGTTSIDVIGLIEKSIKKCGVPPSIIGSEQLNSFKDELSILLAEYVSKGIPLWTIEKKVLGMKKYQYILDLPLGTIDVKNTMYRTNVLPSDGTAAASAGTAINAFDQDLTTSCSAGIGGWVSYDFADFVVVATIGILPSATQTLSLIYEYSSDNATWYTLITPPEGTYESGEWYWQDIEVSVSARYYRVRETSVGSLGVTELVFGRNASEIPVARINQDDYQNLPYKNNVGRPLQYWMDRQITPRMFFWPSSDSDFNSIVCWTRRQIQDVGLFTNTLEIPNRWYNNIILSLACRIALEIPKVTDNRVASLTALAKEAENYMWSEERDNSPLHISANIAGYTS